MKTSYKFWYVHKDDDIHINEVAIRFYEGQITTEDEEIFDVESNSFVKTSVTRYRRTKRLTIDELPHLNGKSIKESSGEDCIVYTDKDFGITSNLDDVISFLNNELGKDPSREPVIEQTN